MIDQTEYDIIVELQKNAWQSDSQIARKLGMNETLVTRRINRLLDEGIIRIKAITNLWQLGYNTTAFFGISAMPAELRELCSRLVSMPSIHYVSRTSGRFDVVALATFRSPQELAQFAERDLAEVSGNVRSETLMIMEYKKWDESILTDRRLVSGNSDDDDWSPTWPSQAAPPDPASATIDERDCAILSELQNNARQSEAHIARNLKISQSTVNRRMSRLIRDGFVRIVAVPSASKLGYGTSAHICIEAEVKNIDQICRKLVEVPRIHFVGVTAGRCDILIMVTFQTPQELFAFIKNDLAVLPGFIRSETLINLEVKKLEHSLLPPIGALNVSQVAHT